jgi:hypothetical protein
MSQTMTVLSYTIEGKQAFISYSGRLDREAAISRLKGAYPSKQVNVTSVTYQTS